MNVVGWIVMSPSIIRPSCLVIAFKTPNIGKDLEPFILTLQIANDCYKSEYTHYVYTKTVNVQRCEPLGHRRGPYHD